MDFELEKAVQKTVREAIAAGLLNSAHDLAEGGLAVALAECCIGGKLGATVEITGTDRLDAILFGETCGKIIVSVAPDKQAQFEAHLTQSLADNWQVIGSVSNTNQLQITVNNQAVIAVSVEDMTTNWSEAIARRLHP